MEKRLMLIVNPAAGRGGYKVNFAEALHTLDLGGYRTTLFFTSGRGEATEFAARHAGAFDTVACIGGDGTLSEVLAGLMQLDSPPPVGYMPMGTANDVATTLGLPKNDTVGAARRIVHGTAHPFDVGGFGDDKYFAYIAAFGAFTEVSYATPQEIKNALGHFAYILEGAKSLGKIQPIHVKITADGEAFEDDFLFGAVTNTISLGGVLKLDPDRVLLDDGMYELLLVKNPLNALEAQAMLSALMSQNYDGPLVKMRRASDITFESSHSLSWTIDGEYGGSYSLTHIINNKNAVTLMI